MVATIDNGSSSNSVVTNTYMVINWVITTKKDNGMIYASLYDSKTDDILINADLQYIVKAAQERQYVIDNAQAVMTDISARQFFTLKSRRVKQ